jgi:mono/diheme cytochrome c family protein
VGQTLDTGVVMRALIRALLVLVVVGGLLAAAVVVSILRRGVSARDEPTWAETVIARQMRHLAVPAAARAEPNPTRSTPETLAEARAHFADHCATCHANDGSGSTELGRSLYPKAPDMRLPATQQLSDGELFTIIERGVRLTGMPAWGTGTREGVEQSWYLVHFIRHLPRLTREEIAEMEALNPRSPAEIRQEQEIEKFLAGEDPPSSSRPGANPGRKQGRTP